MKALETRIPPPVILLLALFGMTLATGAPHLPPLILLAVAVLVFLAGIWIFRAAISEFRRANTTLDSVNPQEASLVVSSGIYSRSRNPIYSAMIVLLLGWAIFLATPWEIIGPLAFFLYIQRFQVLPEERALAVKFGEEYEQYKLKVRRWL